MEYLLGKSFHPGGPKLTRQLASAGLISRNSSVLDLACGIGNTARIVAADFGASVTGFDISRPNVHRAATVSTEAGLDEKTAFVCGSAERLPFNARSFEVVLCECSLCLFGNIDNALAEVFRVLKPGGRIGVSDFCLNAPPPKALEGPLGQALCIANASSAEALQTALSRAGFVHVRLRVVNWALTQMIDRVRRNLAVLIAAEPADLALPASWNDPVPVLAALEQFILSNGACYVIVTGRKPSAKTGLVCTNSRKQK